MRRPLSIPTDDLIDGCDLCLKNAFQFAKEADLLLRNGFETHAYALIILGFQELGKFGELLESFVTAFNVNASNAVVTGFFDHRLKMQARMQHYLASEKEERAYWRQSPFARPLTKAERQWEKVFRSASFKKSVKDLSRDGESERLAATYVDFDARKTKWVPPHAPKRDIVEAQKRLLAAEASALELTLQIKPPWVALMAWKAQGLKEKPATKSGREQAIPKIS